MWLLIMCRFVCFRVGQVFWFHDSLGSMLVLHKLIHFSYYFHPPVQARFSSTYVNWNPLFVIVVLSFAWFLWTLQDYYSWLLGHLHNIILHDSDQFLKAVPVMYLLRGKDTVLNRRLTLQIYVFQWPLTRDYQPSENLTHPSHIL